MFEHCYAAEPISNHLITGDDWSESESGVAGKWNGEKSLVAVAQQTPTSLLLLATLDHLSSLYSQDPEESRTLFKGGILKFS